MATRNEKILGTLLGASLGAIIASKYRSIQNNETQKTSVFRDTFKGAFMGGVSGFGLASLFGSTNDTVNYSLYDGNKKVYDGITFKYRVPLREREHKKSGKKFTKMIVDNPKPRMEALRLEKKLIKLHRPVYNVQHNKN